VDVILLYFFSGYNPATLP